MSVRELWPGGPLYEGEGVQTDALALADFAGAARASRAADLGCGCGILLLLLAERFPEARLDGVEVRPAAAERAGENLRVNGLAERCRIFTADLRNRPLEKNAYDLVVSNPPYFAPGRGLCSPDADKAAMRQESATVEELCAAAAPLLRHLGRFCVVYRPERLYELMCAMDRAGLAPKRLRCVQGRAESAPSLVLLEGRKGGKTGLSIEPPLILNDDAGRSSTEWQRITHWGEGEKT
ncbi:MAG: methyltransferase domain-containing protein [Ruminococcaceae bacterium]|nr:methyltransferase domain-containing protein [Oscillospiraceae bacterium]